MDFDIESMVPTAPVQADDGTSYVPPAPPVWPEFSLVRIGSDGELISSVKRKSKIVAILIAVVLGVYGLHLAYLGYGSKKVIVRFLLNCILVGFVLTLVDIIKIAAGKMNDAYGVPLK